MKFLSKTSFFKSFLKSNYSFDYVLAAFEGKYFGFSLKNSPEGRNVRVQAMAWISKRFSVCCLPRSWSLTSSSKIKNGPIAMPIMHPIGSASPMIVVALPLSESGNHLVATLLIET